MSDTTLYKKILQELNTIIIENKNIKGYKLPSERALATKFSSSRPPIRAAYQQLVKQDLVEVVHGKGYFIKNADKSSLKSSQLKIQVLFVTPSLKTNFMQQLHSGVSKFCEDRNIELSIKITDESEKKEKKLLESLSYSNYDGLILFPVDNEYYNEPLLKLSIAKYPTVIIDRYIKTLNLSFVSTDNHKAMMDTIKYLHNKKYKNIVYVTFEPSLATTNEERINGYNNGMLKYYGYTLASNMLTLKSNNKDYIYNEIKTFLQENPNTDALIITDTFLSAAYLAISELNYKVPDQLRLVVFDNEISFAEKKLMSPYIIEQEGEKIGHFAAMHLYNQITTGNKRIVSKKFPAKIIDPDFKPIP